MSLALFFVPFFSYKQATVNPSTLFEVYRYYPKLFCKTLLKVPGAHFLPNFFEFLQEALFLLKEELQKIGFFFPDYLPI
jgi:hypothetical protein